MSVLYCVNLELLIYFTLFVKYVLIILIFVGQKVVDEMAVGKPPVGQTACQSSGLSVKRLSVNRLSVNRPTPDCSFP
jgi:hypothetical protein